MDSKQVLTISCQIRYPFKCVIYRQSRMLTHRPQGNMVISLHTQEKTPHVFQARLPMTANWRDFKSGILLMGCVILTGCENPAIKKRKFKNNR